MTIEVALIMSAISLAFGIYSGVANLKRNSKTDTKTDTTIRGHDVNDNTGTATCGILYDNTCFVLRYVIGV